MLKFPDLTNETRVAHQMYVIREMTHLHITREVAQATIETGCITPRIYAVTMCGQTWEHGFAVEMDQTNNKATPICKRCATKAAK